jgi:predicted translin family RNA/ssDNA-binding protein
MYQRDYILRMIEMLGEILRIIFGWIKKGDFEQASLNLENAYRTLLREDASLFHAIPVNELTDRLLGEHNYTHGHLEVLAELFFAEAELRYAKNNLEGSLVFYEKSITLFLFLEKELRTFSAERQTKIAAIQNRISELTAH